MIFAFSSLGLVLLRLFIGYLADKEEINTINKVFVPGAIVKIYRRTSKVFDTVKPRGEYEVLGVKNEYVRLKNLETGKESEENIHILKKYSDECKVYHDDRLIAFFRDNITNYYFNKKNRGLKKKNIKDNCA